MESLAFSIEVDVVWASLGRRRFVQVGGVEPGVRWDVSPVEGRDEAAGVGLMAAGWVFG